MDEKNGQKHDLNFYVELLEKAKNVPKEEWEAYLSDAPILSTPNKPTQGKPKEN